VSLIILAFAGGLLAVFSPCVLPIVPLVFSRAVRPSGERALTLAGLGITFAGVATAGTLGIEWIGAAGEVGRWLALAFMGVISLSLASERVLNDAETKLRDLLACQNNTRQTGGQSTGKSRKSNAPRKTRTPSLLIRSQALYPVELWARLVSQRLTGSG
jgi:cytochrome c biogenesis protein CcdA